MVVTQDFSGKIAVITGGARGIGYATARMMAAGGASVALVDIDGDQAETAAGRLAEETGMRVIGVATDVTDLGQVQAMAARVGEELGAPRILVTCAALVDDKKFLESEPEDWRRMIDVCLYGVMNCLHALLPGMVDQGHGRVICIASDSGRLGQARLSYYAAAKGGVMALVKSIAQEVGRDGVTLNVVSPGATNTELRQAREEAARAHLGEERYQQRVKTILRMYPLGRLGEPEDLAAAISFLASDEAAWITGQVLSVNGGFAMP